MEWFEEGTIGVRINIEKSELLYRKLAEKMNRNG